MRRWAIVNALFFFVSFTIFTFVIYQFVITGYIRQQDRNIRASLNPLVQMLAKSDAELTTDNLREYFPYNTNYVSTSGPEGNYIQTPKLMTGLINSKNHLFIYDVNHVIIFTTLRASFPFHDSTDGKVIATVVNGERGLLVSEPVDSLHTGKVIAYIQSFYSLSSFYAMQNTLLLWLIILEFFAVILSIGFGYLMARHIVKPIQQLRTAMNNVAQHPEVEFIPVSLNADDEIKDLAEIYNTMMAKLNSYLEAQKRFVSDASHELRTPLAVIDGHINLLRRWGKDDPAVMEESLNISLEEIGRMKTMLEEMLALSRLENNRPKLENLDCDAVEVASQQVKNFQLLHPDFEISLDNQLTDKTHILVDADHYEQALSILLDNAVKYSVRGPKTIRVSLYYDEEGRICSAVADQGLGIDEDDVTHLFERFFRVDKARNRAIGGTGLGLPILSRIAENYQGEIVVDSQLDQGSNFIVKFPIKTAP